MEERYAKYTLDEEAMEIIKGHSISMIYKVISNIQPLNYNITIPNDRDPLAIMMGNNHLKSTWKHSLEFYYNYMHNKKAIFIGTYLKYNLYQNQLALGYSYNRQMGAYTYTPDNVNGNYLIEGNANFSFPLDKAHRLTFSGNTNANLYQNVDLIGIEGETNGNLRSSVHNLYLTQGLNLLYDFGKIKVGAKGNGTWTHATSKREDFSTINAADFNYGFTFKADLPIGFGISTDLTVYSRRGYADNSMNDNNIVWNASLSKRFLNNRLTLSMDGFDILHQLSNIRQTLNGQGRTETSYNVIPRYAMLRLIYRFNVLPKKI